MHLNAIRMEVIRIRISIERQTIIRRSFGIAGNFNEVQLAEKNRLLQQRAAIEREKKPSCVICFGNFSPFTIVVTAFCGHIYCQKCHTACINLNNRCGCCTQDFGVISNSYRIFFRFNRLKLICRHCCFEITEGTSLVSLRCGDVFCRQCFDIMTGRCFGCSGELGGSNRAITLHLAFNYSNET